ncbi:hypothetical protein [Bartonella sp. MR168JLCBS]|uniref:hypothetical protein n=1 Tax=Bartonella sp. MR168JLCBS TaxID=3243556 RepID=UPI0035CFB9A4
MEKDHDESIQDKNKRSSTSFKNLITEYRYGAFELDIKKGKQEYKKRNAKHGLVGEQLSKIRKIYFVQFVSIRAFF